MKAFIMVSMFMLSLFLILNVIFWAWPFLTHPIVFSIWFGFILIVIFRFFVRDTK